MNENENEVIDSTNDTEETANDIVVDLDEESNDTVDVDALRKEVATLKAQKERWRKKAEKPEVVEKTETPAPNALSTEDVYVLLKNNVEQEDIQEVVEYANLKKIPISEALKSNVVKNILKEKAESRSVAQATHTGTAKRGSTKVSDDELLANAKKGLLPESEADLARLTELRYKK